MTENQLNKAQDAFVKYKEITMIKERLQRYLDDTGSSTSEDFSMLAYLDTKINEAKNTFSAM